MPDIYRQNGYTSRQDYLNQLAEDYVTDPETVQALATILGPEEDFDQLPAELQGLHGDDE